MQARFIGAPDLIKILAAKLAEVGVEAREYPSRSGSDLRLYVTIDDRDAERLLASATSSKAQSGGAERLKPTLRSGLKSPRARR